MSYVAFVPARSGSKRVPGKNIKLLAGKPLIIWTLEAFMKVEKVEKIILSTDSMEYWEIAQKYLGSDKLALDLRSAEEAGDNVKVFDYLKSNHKKIFGSEYENFIMGLPTVPFRNSLHVEEAVEMFENESKPVFSASEYGFPISFAFHMDEVAGWKPAFDSCPMTTGNTRSQDQKKAYHPNGAIYVRSIKSLNDTSTSTLYHNALPYLMNQNDSIDIDNEVDFLMASAVAEANK